MRGAWDGRFPLMMPCHRLTIHAVGFIDPAGRPICVNGKKFLNACLTIYIRTEVENCPIADFFDLVEIEVQCIGNLVYDL